MKPALEGLERLQFVSLKNAVLCANCELISEVTEACCPACGSKALLSISRVLGGTVQEHPPAIEAQVGDASAWDELAADGPVTTGLVTAFS